MSWESWPGNSRCSCCTTSIAGSFGFGDAKEELVTRVVELEKAPQVQLELFIEPLERLEDRHGGRVVDARDGLA